MIYHGLVRVFLELHKSNASHMLQFAAFHVVQLITIEIGYHGRRCDPQCLLAIHIPGNDIVCVQQRLSKGTNKKYNANKKRKKKNKKKTSWLVSLYGSRPGLMAVGYGKATL